MRETEEEGPEMRGSGQWDPRIFVSAAARAVSRDPRDRGGPCGRRHLPAPISPPPLGSNAPMRLGRVGT